MQDLISSLSALQTRQTPYAVYGTEVPRTMPGSKQFWISYRLDVVAFVEQRELPDFFNSRSSGLLASSTDYTAAWLGASSSMKEAQDWAKR